MENTIIMMRLDKYLADMDIGTRSELKKHIRKGAATVNGQVVKQPEFKVSEEDSVTFLGVEVHYEGAIYIMLHKPSGVVSATKDNYDTTVIELLDDVNSKDIFPVGRLDKDTEGLLLITNDGALSHRLLSPKKHVDKVYLADVEGELSETDIQAFLDGLDIRTDEERLKGFESSPTLPAKLEILESGPISKARITIREGKFHQIKRMFHAVGKEVTYLKRISMGPIVLDDTLELGEYRDLTLEELEVLGVTLEH